MLGSGKKLHWGNNKIFFNLKIKKKHGGNGYGKQRADSESVLDTSSMNIYLYGLRKPKSHLR